jgi:hypothetical protein
VKKARGIWGGRPGALLAGGAVGTGIGAIVTLSPGSSERPPGAVKADGGVSEGCGCPIARCAPDAATISTTTGTIGSRAARQRRRFLVRLMPPSFARQRKTVTNVERRARIHPTRIFCIEDECVATFVAVRMGVCAWRVPAQRYRVRRARSG